MGSLLSHLGIGYLLYNVVKSETRFMMSSGGEAVSSLGAPLRKPLQTLEAKTRMREHLKIS